MGACTRACALDVVPSFQAYKRSKSRAHDPSRAPPPPALSPVAATVSISSADAQRVADALDDEIAKFEVCGLCPLCRCIVRVLMASSTTAFSFFTSDLLLQPISFPSLPLAASRCLSLPSSFCRVCLACKCAVADSEAEEGAA